MSSIVLKKMPPEGGDLFIGGGGDVGDGFVDGVDAYSHDNSGGHDPVSQVACDPLPNEYEYEDNDLVYIS